MKILSLSDIEVNLVYSPQIATRFRGVDLVIGCGDLQNYYLDYIVSMLNVPMYFVHGNHVHNDPTEPEDPQGGCNLHGRVMRDRMTGLLLAGLEGSMQYNFGPHQYSQSQMWMLAWMLGNRFFLNKMRFGRYLDVLVTHAPPWRIHDADDLPHRGFKAFRWLMRVYKPALLIHGHIHLYRQDAVSETKFFDTRVINTFPYRVTDLVIGPVARQEVRPGAV
jgi:Icc-related predicted phosphoesterase